MPGSLARLTNPPAGTSTGVKPEISTVEPSVESSVASSVPAAIPSTLVASLTELLENVAMKVPLPSCADTTTALSTSSGPLR